MILSDRSIAAALEEGRIVIDPMGENAIQPSSVDLRVDAEFRVFNNHLYPYIDVRDEQPDLTQPLTVAPDQPFILHPGEFVLGSTYEKVTLPRDLVARIEGKALAVDTPIPTPDGWTTMGRIRPGDLVYGGDGRVTMVVAATEVMDDRPCYRIRFSDHTEVVADADHLWETTDRYDRRLKRAGRLRTTEEISRRIRQGRDYVHRVRICPPLAGVTKDLPIDPYVLGAWIGDGTSTAAEITTADQQILDELVALGYGVHRASGPLAYRVGGEGHTRDPRTGRYCANGSLSSRLRDVGVMGDKHIPIDYMRADLTQRQALLEGLMDTDGYVDALGRCDLTTVKPSLAEQYHELVASLGFRPTTVEKRAVLDGRDIGPKYEVQFTPDRPVFRLDRKLRRQKREGSFNRGRSIVSVESVEPVPVRCIQVAADDGMFLITRSYIPTHNSSLGRLGLLVHATAGFVDAGFSGWLTLELSNVANLPIAIYPQMKIGQLAFFQLDREAAHAYGDAELGSKYQGQRGPTASRYFRNFDGG